MKTKDLIARLQKCDPSGEEEVYVGNHDILGVAGMPAYYDGAAQQLIRGPKDPKDKDPYDTVVGGKYIRTGAKISIMAHSFDDALFNDPEMPIDVSEVDHYYKDRLEQMRQENRDIIAKVRGEKP